MYEFLVELGTGFALGLFIVVKGPWGPCQMHHEGTSHWFLRRLRTGVILDATAKQFKTVSDYDKARCRGSSPTGHLSVLGGS